MYTNDIDLLQQVHFAHVFYCHTSYLQTVREDHLTVYFPTNQLLDQLLNDETTFRIDLPNEPTNDESSIMSHRIGFDHLIDHESDHDLMKSVYRWIHIQLTYDQNLNFINTCCLHIYLFLLHLFVVLQKTDSMNDDFMKFIKKQVLTRAFLNNLETTKVYSRTITWIIHSKKTACSANC